MLAKIGTGANGHLPAAAGIFVDDVGAGDVRRHQVGRELDAVELEVEDLRQRPYQQRLGEAGHADDQAVAADEQRQQHLIDDVLLTDDQLGQLGFNLLATCIHSIRKSNVLRRIHGDDFFLTSLCSRCVLTRA
jgi:hypothetical protein